MSSQITTTTAKGLLFDMDGTLLDSTPAVEAVWEEFAEKYNQDLTHILNTSHGIRTQDNLRRLRGITDPQELKTAVDLFENDIVVCARRLEQQGKTGLVILPGVSDILAEVQRAPADKPVWAVVTSATDIYASQAMPTAGVPSPPRLITGDMCELGKPAPEPYLRGAKLLELDPKDCIVFEDAPSGIRAGLAAGCRVLAVCTSHKRQQVDNLGATWVVDDLSKVKAKLVAGGVQLEIDESH